MRRLIIQNSIFVKSCDQIVSSFWSHDFLFLSFGIFEFCFINIIITAMEGLRCGKFENYPNNILLEHLEPPSDNIVSAIRDRISLSKGLFI